MGVTSWLVDCCGVCLIHSIYCLSVELYQINSLVISLNLQALEVVVVVVVVVVIIIFALE